MEPRRHGLKARLGAVALALEFAASALAAAAVGAQAPTELTLEDAVALAKGSSPMYLSTQNDQASANWQVREAYGQFLPSLNASLNGTWQEAGAQRFGTIVFDDQITDWYFSGYTLGLGMTIDGNTIFGIPNARGRARDYPHQFSGGMRQRAMIAMALVHNPDVLIADEPTTALDVTVQAQILRLLRDLQQSRGMSILLITHDLGIVNELADRVAVMYAGRIVEIGPVRDVIQAPRHPYTAGLMGSIPRIGARKKLIQIEGAMPRLNAIPAGCAFHPRCPRRFERCLAERPGLIGAGAGEAACWLHAAA